MLPGMVHKSILRRILYVALILFLIAAALVLLVAVPQYVAWRSAGTRAGSGASIPLVSADTPLIGWLMPLLQQWIGSTSASSVFVSSSSSATGAATVFALHGQSRRIFCLVRNSAIPQASGPVSLLFQWSQGSPLPIFSFSENSVAGQSPYTYFIISTAGRYRCDVKANGRPVGLAQFTVTP